jgi:uncharacterized protein (DUF2384 family)
VAASSEVKERIDGFLEDVMIMATEELPDSAADWPNMEDWQQTSWCSEWDQAMVTTLGELERRSLADEMTSEQSRRYVRLLRILKEQLPVLQGLELQEPAVDLDRALSRVQQALVAAPA